MFRTRSGSVSVTASLQPESGQIVLYNLSDFRHPIQFRFSKKARIILCKTDPDPIWTAWSGFGQTHLVWKQASLQESSGSVSGRTQPARYQFPTLRLCCVLSQTTSRIIVCKTSQDSDLVLAACVRFWPNGSGHEASRCARLTDPARFWPCQRCRSGSDPACLLGSTAYWGSKYLLFVIPSLVTKGWAARKILFSQTIIATMTHRPTDRALRNSGQGRVYEMRYWGQV